MSESATLDAPRWRRVIATLIDAVLVPALSLLLVMIFGTVEHAEDYQDFTSLMVQVVLLAIAAYVLLNGELLRRSGQTVGMRLLKVKIVDNTTGERPPIWKLLVLRAPFFAMIFLLPAFSLTLIPLLDMAPAFAKSRRCIHDYVAGTRVVSASAGPNQSARITSPI